METYRFTSTDSEKSINNFNSKLTKQYVMAYSLTKIILRILKTGHQTPHFKISTRASAYNSAAAMTLRYGRREQQQLESLLVMA